MKKEYIKPITNIHNVAIHSMICLSTTDTPADPDVDVETKEREDDVWTHGFWN